MMFLVIVIVFSIIIICFEYLYINNIFIKFCRANWVIMNGTKYQTPCTLIVGKMEDDNLIFGNVINIFIHNQTLLLFEVEI